MSLPWGMPWGLRLTLALPPAARPSPAHQEPRAARAALAAQRVACSPDTPRVTLLTDLRCPHPRDAPAPLRSPYATLRTIRCTTLPYARYAAALTLRSYARYARCAPHDHLTSQAHNPRHAKAPGTHKARGTRSSAGPAQARRRVVQRRAASCCVVGQRRGNDQAVSCSVGLSMKRSELAELGSELAQAGREAGIGWT